MTRPYRRLIVEYNGSRYERKSFVNLTEVFAFANGRPVTREGDFYPTREMEMRHVTGAEYAEFDNGDILVAAATAEGSDLPAYVAMYGLVRLSDDS